MTTFRDKCSFEILRVRAREGSGLGQKVADFQNIHEDLWRLNLRLLKITQNKYRLEFNSNFANRFNQESYLLWLDLTSQSEARNFRKNS